MKNKKQVTTSKLGIIAAAAASVVFFVAGAFGAVYVEVWLGIVRPILELGRAHDAGTLTGSVIAVNVIWFLLRSLIAAAVLIVGVVLGSYFAQIARILSLRA